MPKVQEIKKKYRVRDGTIRTCKWYFMTLPKPVGKELDLRNKDTVFLKKIGENWVMTKEGEGVRTKVYYTDRYVFILKKEIVKDMEVKKGDRILFVFEDGLGWKLVKENDSSVLQSIDRQTRH